MKKSKKIYLQRVINLAWVVWGVLFIVGIIFFVFTFSRYPAVEYSSQSYMFPWPGMLPDDRLYKIKVARNKIIEKLIIDPAKKVEFDLLMADKTIYASSILMKKGNVVLAKETALKGENYYSMLVQDYNRALLEGKKISSDLDKKITIAAKKHQEVFQDLEDIALGEDKKAFQAAYNFSKINYNFIQGLRKPKENLK